MPEPKELIPLHGGYRKSQNFQAELLVIKDLLR